MKKLISLVLAGVLTAGMAFSLMGCGDSTEEEPSPSEAETATAAATETESESGSGTAGTAEGTNVVVSNTVEKNVPVEEETVENTNTFDPFEGVSVEFYGISPNIAAFVVVSDDAMYDETAYTLTRSSSDHAYLTHYAMEGLSDGDVVAVDVSEALTNVTTQQTGAVPVSLFKNFAVKGEGNVILQYSDFSGEDLDRIALAGANYVQNYLNTEFMGSGLETNGITVASIDYTGDNFFYVSSDGQYNRLYIAYCLNFGECTPSSQVNKRSCNYQSLYCVAYTPNVMMDRDGQISVYAGHNDELMTFQNYSTDVSDIEMSFGISSEMYISGSKDSSYGRKITLGDCFETKEDIYSCYTDILTINKGAINEDGLVLAGSTRSA